MEAARADLQIPPRPRRGVARTYAWSVLREVSAAGLVGLLGAWGCAELALLLTGV